MCRAVLQSEEGQTTAKGINNGILYHYGNTLSPVGLVGWKVFRILQKKLVGDVTNRREFSLIR